MALGIRDGNGGEFGEVEHERLGVRGNGSGAAVDAIATPKGTPTMIGQPMEDVIPRSRSGCQRAIALIVTHACRRTGAPHGLQGGPFFELPGESRGTMP